MIGSTDTCEHTIVPVCMTCRAVGGGAAGAAGAAPLFVPSIWPLTAQSHIIMVHAHTRVRTINNNMQTARKTAGADSASSSI